MSGPLRVVHYVNQFFGGIGGEDQAHVGVTAKAGPVGPGRALETALGDGARVEATLIGGGHFLPARGEGGPRRTPPRPLRSSTTRSARAPRAARGATGTPARAPATW